MADYNVIIPWILVFIIQDVSYGAVLSGSASAAVEGQPFTFTCTLETAVTAGGITFARKLPTESVRSTFYTVTITVDSCKGGGAGQTPVPCTPTTCSCSDDRKVISFTVGSVPKAWHQSQWTCRDAFGFITESSAIKLNVIALVTSVTLQSPPAAGSDLALNEGTSTNLVCVTSACRPSANVQWYIGNTNYTSSSSQTVSDVTGNLHITTNTLIFTPNRNMNGQTLKCSAYNYDDTANTVSYATQLNVRYGPGNSVKLDPSQEAYTKNENDILPSITCEADCKPSCSYVWMLAGNKNTSGPVLSLSTLEREEQGTYGCVARNIVGESVKTVTISVQYGPADSVTLNPSTEAYTKNENDKLPDITCGADCRPSCSYVWMLPSNTNNTGSVLSLSTLNRDEQGTYKCVARNIVGESVKIITITVRYGPADSVTLNPSNQVYTKNENEILPDIICEADCRPSCSFVWMLPSNTNNTGQVLSLSTLNRDEQGTYTCVARNIVGESVKTVTITVRYGPGDSIKFNQSSNTITQVENTTLTPVDCSADCRPQCTTTWTSDTGNGNLPNPLTLGQLKRNEAGQYTCTATNVVSSNTKSLIVHVKYPPIISSLRYVTDGPNVSEHSAIQLLCKVDSYPRSTIKWTNESGQSLQTDSSSLNSTFTLHQANCFDTGFYRCRASNEVGAHASQSILINVLCHPRLYRNSTDLIGIGNNDNMNASVPFVANPSPKFTWMFRKNISQNFTVLHNNSNNFMVFNHRKHVVYTSEAIRNSMREEDFGFYTLEAVNSIGRNEFTVHVVSKRAPDPPSGVKAECVHYNTARVTWISMFNGGSRQHFRIGVKTSKEITFTKGGKYEDVGKDKSMTGIVNDLKEKTVYFFTVVAINDFGTSQLLHILDCRTPTNDNIQNDMEEKTMGNIPNTASVALFSVSALLIISAITLFGIYLYKRRRNNYKQRSNNEERANGGKTEGNWTHVGQSLNLTQTYEELGQVEQRIDNQYEDLNQTSKRTTEMTTTGVYDALGRCEPPNQYEQIKPKQRQKGPVYENTFIK